MPTITLEGDANGAPHLDPSAYARKFSGKYSHRTITGGIGHNLPQEAPQAFADAVVEVDGYSGFACGILRAVLAVSMRSEPLILSRSLAAYPVFHPVRHSTIVAHPKGVPLVIHTD